jgi:hypothetical protein
MTKPAITQLTRHSHYTSENVRNLRLFPTEMKPKIRPMQIREAKDFLVTQAAELILVALLARHFWLLHNRRRSWTGQDS